MTIKRVPVLIQAAAELSEAADAASDSLALSRSGAETGTQIN